MRLAFLSVAIWWLVFSIPLFRRVPEPQAVLALDELRGKSPIRAVLARLAETSRELRRYRQGFLMLLAFLIYNDGIGTIIRMATIYGTEMGIDQGAMIGPSCSSSSSAFPFRFSSACWPARSGPSGRSSSGSSLTLGSASSATPCAPKRIS